MTMEERLSKLEQVFIKYAPDAMDDFNRFKESILKLPHDDQADVHVAEELRGAQGRI